MTHKEQDHRAIHYLFIINPAAGQPNRPTLADDLRAAVIDDPLLNTCTLAWTERPGHASLLAADFARQYGEQAMIVACGGDGTAHEVANGLIGTAAAMTILPLGTGNDFARTALSSERLDDLLPRLSAARIMPIDLLWVNGKTCLNITSFGFDTRVQRLMMQINRHFRFLGKLSYPLAIAAGLLGNKHFRMKRQLEGESEQPTDYILAALCNGRYYGGGFNPAPYAQLDDGQIELVWVDPLPLLKILKLIPLYKKGRHLADPAVHAVSIRSGSLSALPGQQLLGNIDGELFEAGQIDFHVLPAAIRFAFY